MSQQPVRTVSGQSSNNTCCHCLIFRPAAVWNRRLKKAMHGRTDAAVISSSFGNLQSLSAEPANRFLQLSGPPWDSHMTRSRRDDVFAVSSMAQKQEVLNRAGALELESSNSRDSHDPSPRTFASGLSVALLEKTHRSLGREDKQHEYHLPFIQQSQNQLPKFSSPKNMEDKHCEHLCRMDASSMSDASYHT